VHLWVSRVTDDGKRPIGDRRQRLPPAEQKLINSGRRMPTSVHGN
jgi:hypothetical protein